LNWWRKLIPKKADAGGAPGERRQLAGVVADEHGFYHASRRQGVIYSPFNEYWLKRIDGFRRVPLPAPITD